MMFKLAFVGLRSASLQWQYHAYPSCKFSSGFSAYPKSEKGPNRAGKQMLNPTGICFQFSTSHMVELISKV